MLPVLLLPPSEGKHAGGSGSWSPESGVFGALAGARTTVAESLAAAMDVPVLAAGLTGVRGARHTEAAAANASVCGGPALPAWRRYSGVVWEHLEPATLSPAARRRARRIVVVSALGGLFAFADPVPEYKLKMGANLPPLGVLSTFWLAALGEALRQFAGRAPIVDLLPGEHRRALPAGLSSLQVDFLTSTGRAVGHDAKAAKGAFTRHLLESGGSVEAAASSFHWRGWSGDVTGASRIAVTYASR